MTVKNQGRAVIVSHRDLVFSARVFSVKNNFIFKKRVVRDVHAVTYRAVWGRAIREVPYRAVPRVYRAVTGFS